MEVRPDIRFYSEAALLHPDIFEQALREKEFICSALTLNTLPEGWKLVGIAQSYGSQHIKEILEEYYPIDEDLTKNWDVYMAVEYDKFVRPDEVIFVGEKWETDLASKYFADGMLQTVN